MDGFQVRRPYLHQTIYIYKNFLEMLNLFSSNVDFLERESNAKLRTLIL